MAELYFKAVGLLATETAFAPNINDGTNTKRILAAFDDSTQEYRNGSLKVPTALDVSGTVTFRTVGYATTAVAAKTVEFDFDHYAVEHGEAGDGAGPYTTESSGAKSIDGTTQDDIDIFTWTETVSNLGWTAGDEVFFRISRNTGANDDLVGDYNLESLAISIPEA